MKTALIVIVALAGIFFMAKKYNVFSALKTEAFKKDLKKVTEENDEGRKVHIQKKWQLPPSLKELSGIVYVSDGVFAGIEDEAGTIFFYNTHTATIDKQIQFAGHGDFEALALVGQSAYALRSDGKLFEIADINKTTPDVKEYKDLFAEKQELEGLCYDKANNRLLLCVKEGPKGIKDFKGIYAFDLATKKLNPEPVLKINMEDEAFKAFDTKKEKHVVMPSDIAIHPLTNDIYITDGHNFHLILMSANGKIKNVYPLSKNDFAQAEGITFSPAGEMFISNEGKTENANILKVSID